MWRPSAPLCFHLQLHCATANAHRVSIISDILFRIRAAAAGGVAAARLSARLEAAERRGPTWGGLACSSGSPPWRGWSRATFPRSCAAHATPPAQTHPLTQPIAYLSSASASHVQPTLAIIPYLPQPSLPSGRSLARDRGGGEARGGSGGEEQEGRRRGGKSWV